MRLSTTDLKLLADLAIAAAVEAGKMIVQSRPNDVQHKSSGASLASQVVTEIDRRSEDIIVDMLSPTLGPYELGLLTEEQDDDASRFTAEHFWCIDPLDGTLPFIEGSPGYSVSIALVGRGGIPWIGVVYDPIEDTTFHAIRHDGIYRNTQLWKSSDMYGGETNADVLSVFVDRSFSASDDHDVTVGGLEQIARVRGVDGIQIHSGRGGVLNACGVLDNPPACYFKFPSPTGGGSVWDFAATACLFEEVGAVVADIYGGALDLNRADSTSMNHRGVLFATDADLAAQIQTLHRSA